MRTIHLVGSIGLSDEGAVFRALAEILDDRAPRYPDGEPGERSDWISWQRKVFAAHPRFEAADDVRSYRDGGPARYFRLRSMARTDALEFGEIGYAHAAIRSYRTFARLKSAGVIPAATRFMVAIPTPVAVLTAFVAPEQRAEVEPAYEQAIVREVQQIAAEIPHSELAMQWDVCFEVLSQDGAFPLHYEDVLAGSLARLERLGASVPEGVQLGYHLCYGDPEHKHIQEPRDTATAVQFANGIAARVPHSLAWLHLPVPRSRCDHTYFAPLEQLQVPASTELILGLLHLTDGVAGAQRRIAAAENVLAKFGIATECGFGRRDPATIPQLLRMHRDVADL